MAADLLVNNAEKVLHFDVYRTVVLGHYMRFWGMPEYRKIVTGPTGVLAFEVYTFPTSQNKHVLHVATVGLAECRKAVGGEEGHEYFMTLPEDFGGSTMDEVINYFVDFCVHSLENLNHAELPRVMGESKLAPAKWNTRAMLVDEPRGESEEFDQVQINDSLSVEFQWVIPIYQNEYKFILEHGIEEFDELAQGAKLSIADITRPSFVPS